MCSFCATVYMQLKTRGPTRLQHYIDMKKFQCSSQMCVPEYVYVPHVRCIYIFLILLTHEGLHNERVRVSGILCPVCLNCFLRRYRIKQEQIWMLFGFDARALKITKPYRLASWEPPENIFIFSCDVLLLQQKIYLRFYFYKKKDLFSFRQIQKPQNPIIINSVSDSQSKGTNVCSFS